VFCCFFKRKLSILKPKLTLCYKGQVKCWSWWNMMTCQLYICLVELN
jgi:hypothetical protein